MSNEEKNKKSLRFFHFIQFYTFFSTRVMLVILQPTTTMVTDAKNEMSTKEES